MEKLILSMDINAPRETVWDAITQDASYRRWTSVFQPTSHFTGGWKEGDSIHFVGINEDGQKEGMVSEIAASRYPEHISIRHLGLLRNGEVDTTSDDVKAWAPSFENYTLEKIADHKTRFHLEMDINEDYYSMFENLWPKAMAMMKDICEEKAGAPTRITVVAMVGGEEGKVWAYWTDPDHITKWNFASDDWHCPKAENDVRVGGKIKATMAAKDGSMSFDFEGTYTRVDYGERLDYVLGDGRTVEVLFTFQSDKICVIENFEAETTNPPDMQRAGWQAILDNFKKHVVED